ncbi:uncharacterized protein LOC119357945 [Triticum dicoccoides]|uniref:uncharacterized protein LOC119357945 n=1 Tax=Triticum dicoccoides TaxID=85692 RepID=UPI00188FADEE|nr:uncharacterized protein LOC119357945 [Triticum dicoccoides]
MAPKIQTESVLSETMRLNIGGSTFEDEVLQLSDVSHDEVMRAQRTLEDVFMECLPTSILESPHDDPICYLASGAVRTPVTRALPPRFASTSTSTSTTRLPLRGIRESTFAFHVSAASVPRPPAMDYTTRVIAFHGLFHTINVIVFTGNSLILLGELNLNLRQGVCTISEKKLIERVSDYYMTKATHKVSKIRKTTNKSVKRLAQPIQCKMMLTSVEHMENSGELKLFEQLGIKVYHANVVDPKLMMFTAVFLNNCIAGELIDDFLSKKHTQLTAYGIQSIKQQMIDKNETICALFWKNHFHVMLQLHGTLLLLQNTSDQVEKPIAWQHINDVLDSSWTQGNDYVAKSVYFRGCWTFIIYPNMNGSSALVALCNAILLRGDVDLSKILDCNLSLNLAQLHQVVFGAKKTVSYTMTPEQWLVAVGCLHQHVDVKINFKNIYNIKITKDLQIFEGLGFRLCHGFIADPEDLNLCNAIGEKYYDCTTESPTSHLKADDHGKLLDKFLKDHDTELTPYGYNISTLFCFHTAIKCNNRIFVLNPSLRSFDEQKIWRSLDTVDGAGATLASLPDPISGKSGEFICINSDCLLAFTSSFNLQRHNYVNHTSSGSTKLDILQHRSEYSNCWDSLSSKESAEILSLEDMQFKNLEGKLIVRILEQRSSQKDGVAMMLLDIRRRSMEGEKITSEVLFAVLDGASEKTLLRSDIRNCKEGGIWDVSPSDIITDMNSLLACHSYLLEKALMNKWLQYKAALAYKVGEDLIATKKSRGKKVNDQNSQGELDISAHSTEDHSSNSTDQHDSPPLEGTKGHSSNSTGQHDDPPLEGTGDGTKDDISQSLKHTEDDSIGNLYDLILEFLRSFRNNDPKKFYRGEIETIKYMGNLDIHIHFPHMKEYSAELAAYIIDHHDSDGVKADISRAAAQYLVEHNIGKPEEEIHEGIKVIMVDLPSPTSNMSFKKYARLNKLIRPFKLPKKFRRLFSLRWKGRLYLMTYAGRRAARGLMNCIIKKHKEKLCWRGEWKLSDMRIEDGLFVIDTEALYVADVEGMAWDYKKYIELLNPFYVIVEQSSSSGSKKKQSSSSGSKKKQSSSSSSKEKQSSNSPPYWEILQTDTMAMPDPFKDPKAFDRFQKYMSAHFAFMPPVSIFQFLCLLFSICDGLRPNNDQQYGPLNVKPKGVENWTPKAIGVFLFNDVFFYSKNGVIVNAYSNTYWYMLKFVRHFSSHILSLTKNTEGQDVQDMILIHLMLACRLDRNLASLIRHIVNQTNMDGLFLRAWQALLASDDKIEEDFLEDQVSESEDEESDTDVEETRDEIEDEDIADLEPFKSEDEE